MLCTVSSSDTVDEVMSRISEADTLRLSALAISWGQYRKRFRKLLSQDHWSFPVIDKSQGARVGHAFTLGVLYVLYDVGSWAQGVPVSAGNSKYGNV